MHPRPPCSNVSMSNKKLTEIKLKSGSVYHTVTFVKILLSQRQDAHAVFVLSGLQRFIPELLCLCQVDFRCKLSKLIDSYQFV